MTLYQAPYVTSLSRATRHGAGYGPWGDALGFAKRQGHGHPYVWVAKRIGCAHEVIKYHNEPYES